MIFFSLLLIIEALICNIISNNTFAPDYELLSIFIVAFNSVALIFALSIHYKNHRDKKIIMYIMISYILRTALMFFDIYGKDIFVLPNSGADSESFHFNAIKFAEHGTKYGITEMTFGMFYKIFGVQRILAQHYNVLMSIVVIMIVEKVLSEFFIGKRAYNIGMLLIAFLPNYMLLSAILLRESLIVFLLTIPIPIFVKWLKTGRFKYLFISCFLTMLASMYHSGAIAPFLGYLIIFVSYDRKSNKFVFSFKTIIYLFLLGIIIISMYNSFLSKVLFAKFSSIESVSDIAEHTTSGLGGGADYIVGGGNATSILDLVKFTPIRMFYYIASPLPWKWRGAGDIIAFVFDAIPYSVSLLGGLLTLKKNTKNKNIMVMFLIINLVAIVIFAWGVNNSGTALRHRNKFISFNVILMGLLISNRLDSNCDKENSKEVTMH